MEQKGLNTLECGSASIGSYRVGEGRELGKTTPARQVSWYEAANVDRKLSKPLKFEDPKLAWVDRYALPENALKNARKEMGSLIRDDFIREYHRSRGVPDVDDPIVLKSLPIPEATDYDSRLKRRQKERKQLHEEMGKKAPKLEKRKAPTGSRPLSKTKKSKKSRKTPENAAGVTESSRDENFALAEFTKW